MVVGAGWSAADARPASATEAPAAINEASRARREVGAGAGAEELLIRGETTQFQLGTAGHRAQRNDRARLQRVP